MNGRSVCRGPDFLHMNRQVPNAFGGFDQFSSADLTVDFPDFSIAA
jgi:hypothetical protein